MSLDLDLLEISQKNIRDLLNDSQTDDLDDFLNTNYRFESIDLLIKELNTLNEQLNGELIELVNGNFNQFVNLSLSLEGSNNLINSIQTSLSSFDVKLSKLISKFGDIDTQLKHIFQFQDDLLVIRYKIQMIKLANSMIANLNSYILTLSSEVDINCYKIVINLIVNIQKLIFDHPAINLKKFNSLLFEVKAILNKVSGTPEEMFELFKMKQMLLEVEIWDSYCYL